MKVSKEQVAKTRKVGGEEEKVSTFFAKHLEVSK